MARTTSVGLDIGTHAVYVAEVNQTRGGPKLNNFGGTSLPAGAVVEGVIVDHEAVTEATRQLVKQAGIKEKRVNVGVSNQHVVVRQVDLPQMTDEELSSALRYQVQEYIPIPVEDAELDFYRLEDVAGDDGVGSVRVLLVAAERETVRKHLSVVEAAGLRPVGMDLNAFAVLRATVPDPESVTAPEMIVDVGSGITNIVIHEHGLPRFVRILVLGGGDITEAIHGQLDIPVDEAEQMKLAVASGRSDHGEARTIVERHMDEFVDEVRGSLDYHLAQSGGAGVEHVVMSGGGAKLKNLRSQLEDALSVPVDLARPLQYLSVGNTSYSAEDLAEVEPLLTTAIGLALGGLE